MSNMGNLNGDLDLLGACFLIKILRCKAYCGSGFALFVVFATWNLDSRESTFIHGLASSFCCAPHCGHSSEAIGISFLHLVHSFKKLLGVYPGAL